jgi:hypothetical protein
MSKDKKVNEDAAPAAPAPTAAPANVTGNIAQLGQVMQVNKRPPLYYEAPAVKIDEPKIRMTSDFEGWTVISLADLERMRSSDSSPKKESVEEPKKDVIEERNALTVDAPAELPTPVGGMTLGAALKTVDALNKDYAPGTNNNPPQMDGQTVADQFDAHLTARKAVAVGDQVRLVRTNDIANVSEIDLESGTIVVKIHNSPETRKLTVNDMELMQPTVTTLESKETEKEKTVLLEKKTQDVGTKLATICFALGMPVSHTYYDSTGNVADMISNMRTKYQKDIEPNKNLQDMLKGIRENTSTEWLNFKVKMYRYLADESKKINNTTLVVNLQKFLMANVALFNYTTNDGEKTTKTKLTPKDVTGLINYLLGR